MRVGGLKLVTIISDSLMIQTLLTSPAVRNVVGSLSRYRLSGCYTVSETRVGSVHGKRGSLPSDTFWLDPLARRGLAWAVLPMASENLLEKLCTSVLTCSIIFELRRL